MPLLAVILHKNLHDRIYFLILLFQHRLSTRCAQVPVFPAIMMSQRFCLFYAGYTAHAPALFYNRVSLANNYADHPADSVRQCTVALNQLLQDERDEYESYLTTASELGKQFELAIAPRPSTYTEYFPWLSTYVELFERQFPMSRIDHYYFLYGRRLAEMTGNCGLADCYLEMQLKCNHELDLSSRIEKCLKDSEFILFKLVASAALLASEPRHLYFNANYKEMNTGFAPFRNIKFENFGESDWNRFREDLKNYKTTVDAGFKKCVGLLKELQV